MLFRSQPARRGRRPGLGGRVAIALPAGADHLVASLAAVLLGAAYAPIDLAAPPARRDAILDDLRPDCVVGPDSAGVDLSPDAAWRTAARPDLPVPQPDDDRLINVMYTSGTTGRPKGVGVTEGGVLRLVEEPWFVEIGPGDRVLQQIGRAHV